MNAELYRLHLEVGRRMGEGSACGKKNRYETEEEGMAASEAHNRWDKRRSDVETYPCAFCDQWHIGKIMPVELLKSIIGRDKQKG